MLVVLMTARALAVFVMVFVLMLVLVAVTFFTVFVMVMLVPMLVAVAFLAVFVMVMLVPMLVAVTFFAMIVMVVRFVSFGLDFFGEKFCIFHSIKNLVSIKHIPRRSNYVSFVVQAADKLYSFRKFFFTCIL